MSKSNLGKVLDDIKRENLTKMYKKHILYNAQFTGDKSKLTIENVNKYINITMEGKDNNFNFWSQDRYFMTGQHIENYNYIIDLWVEPDYRRQGVGRWLLGQVEEPIILCCPLDSPARAFYKALGFSPLAGGGIPGSAWLYKGADGLERLLAEEITEHITYDEGGQYGE